MKASQLTENESAQLRALMVAAGEALGIGIGHSATIAPELLQEIATFHALGGRMHLVIRANPPMIRGEMGRTVESGRIESLLLFEHSVVGYSSEDVFDDASMARH